MRVNPGDDLAIQLQHHAQNAMRRRMLRAEVEGEIAESLFGQVALPADFTNKI